MNAKESRPGLRWSAALLALQLASIPAQAAVLNLSPLMLSVAPGERAAGLNIGNQAQTPTTLQVRLLSWTQDGTRNLYAPADGWVVSPPMVVVPGNDTQLLRVIRRELANAPVEQAYRVFIDELPPADAPSGGAVRVLMRYSLPLFVEASQPTLPDVAWTLQSCGKDWFLQAQNRGGRTSSCWATTSARARKRWPAPMTVCSATCWPDRASAGRCPMASRRPPAMPA